MEQKVELLAPIEVIDTEFYHLVVKDANGKVHYFHKEHENKYGKFKQGEYDGWSMDCICKNEK